MKKLKYYAPYWVSAIIAASAAIVIFLVVLRTTPFIELPELAAELENEQYFIREDGLVMKTEANYHPDAIVDAVSGMPHRIGQLKVKEINEMLPHEYAALICDSNIYVRQDGSTFVRLYGYHGTAWEYIQPVCPPSGLPADAAKTEWEINEISDANGTPSSRIGISVPAKDPEEAIICYLSVKLSDGWYIAAESMRDHISIVENGKLFHRLTIRFPSLQTGEYRIEVCAGGEWYYQELTLTRTGTDTYSLT